MWSCDGWHTVSLVLTICQVGQAKWCCTEGTSKEASQRRCLDSHSWLCWLMGPYLGYWLPWPVDAPDPKICC